MSKAARQRSARERLAEERKRQAQKQQRVRTLMISLTGLVVVALVVVITVYFVNKKDPNAYTGALAPATRQSDGSILATTGAKAPKLEVFEDFQCPICNEFEKSSGNTIKKLAAQGKVNVIYHPFWLFKQQSEPIKGNSQRAANAALCAPANKWIQYHDTIYKHQPAEGSNGFSNKDLIGWAKDLGFDNPTFEQCVKGLQKQSQVDSMTSNAEQTRKVTGTPTVFLNGQSLDLNSTLLNPANLEKTISAAQPMDVTPSTAPSGSASPSATPKK